MSTPLRASLRAFSILGLLVAFATAGYSATPTVTTWTVAGIENTEGAYSGTAQLSMTGLKAQLTLTATTSSGKTIAWSGAGTLDAGAITLTMDAGFVAPGVTATWTAGTAEYVLGDDGTLSGYWALTSTTAKKAGPGGTERLTLQSGSPLLPLGPGMPLPQLPANALPVPLVTQPDEYGCGAASLEAVMFYYRVWDGDLKTLYKPLGTTATYGTMGPPIAAFAQSRGLTAKHVTGAALTDLQASLQNRDPVMLVIQAWKGTATPWATDQNDGHWVVLLGMDANYAYFMDPWAHFALGYMPIAELLTRWHDGTTAADKHEAIFFHGLAPAPGDGLMRMQ
jgi:predicted double-glycine peptidase